MWLWNFFVEKQLDISLLLDKEVTCYELLELLKTNFKDKIEDWRIYENCKKLNTVFSKAKSVYKSLSIRFFLKSSSNDVSLKILLIYYLPL